MAGLYLHIPFCRRKCPYCDFYSVETTPAELQGYPGLLIKHLELIAGTGTPDPIETIYFGGGTPSLLPPEAIGKILDQVLRLFDVTRDAEITLEANPGTVTLDRLIGYRAAGVNRLSLGLQSCTDRHLKALGRLHNQQTGLDAIQFARQAGFDNLSLDLMFALPGQTLAELSGELDTYIELNPEHLSCYGLTAEPKTQLHQQVIAGKLSLPNDSFYADAYLLIHDQLTGAGFDHYEIANYAKDGWQCKHNEAYWQRKPYLGIGAGAHSFIAADWGSRWQVPNNLNDYGSAIERGERPEVFLESFDRESALKETVYLALRTRYGLLDSDLQDTFNCTLAESFPEAVELCSDWMTHKAGRWSLTPRGWLIFDNLIQHFL